VNVAYQPSEKEQEYFVRQEADRLRKLADQHRKEMEAEQREKEKALHYMKCPKCGMELREIEFGDVKIDKCFTCEGLWLDKGELERLQHKETGFVGRLLGALRG
jgi:uncharacterized protein